MELVEYLRKHNLKPTHFAKIARVSIPTVFNWVNGKCKPKPATAYRLQQLTQDEVALADWGYKRVFKGKFTFIKE